MRDRACLYFGIGWCIGLLAGGLADKDHIPALLGWFPRIYTVLGGRPLHVVDTVISGCVFLACCTFVFGWILWHSIGVSKVD